MEKIKKPKKTIVKKEELKKATGGRGTVIGKPRPH